ncbi:MULTISPECIES: CoA pyrophosphatase [Acidianus]|uniref:NUDIX hydrolase n=1 Tax=Candidatus Acidianus copahuensis TaxID=1160895 RepID=A0A031LTM9_9CREN|nr:MULTISPECIES: CoA pyrophosphatase [Acidianus]EZQ11075.1 NUDIX hydrolase [Candidatus Acidianus copahuensis]NON62450.1 CoA pyrophosphatase [Acidianus sp. RZ1]
MECDASVVLIFNEGRFLLIKRAEREGDPWSGDMALPGGHRKKGETCEETAIRECKEEVGIEPKLVRFLGYYSPNNKQLKVAAFLGKSEKMDIIMDDEVSMYFWAKPEQLNEDKECYFLNGFRIWGMTYRILKDFLSQGFNII